MEDPWIHRSENMKCKTCMWYVGKRPATAIGTEASTERSAVAFSVGRCRRHAPAMSGYPVVMIEDWCGDHKLDENRV